MIDDYEFLFPVKRKCLTLSNIKAYIYVGRIIFLISSQTEMPYLIEYQSLYLG